MVTRMIHFETCPARPRAYAFVPMHKAIPLLLATLVLGACTTGPDYRPPATAALGVPVAWSVGQSATREDLSAWWTRFNDPVLSQIIDKAVTDNLEIAQASARLRAAREALISARSQLFPAVSGSAQGGRTETVRGGNPSSNSLSLSLDASYQADLFGGLRRSIEASRADLQASGFNRDAIRLAVESEVATNYVLARTYQAQLALARQTLSIRQDDLEIAGFRVKAGLVSSLDVEQARVAAAQSAASIPAIEQQYNAAVSRLGVLTGEAPGALKLLLIEAAPIPVGPETVGIGIPADVLRRRPDVLAAERNLSAATARIGVAQAQLYPSLSITGSLSTGAASLPGLFDTITGNLFGKLAQTIFDGGALRAQTRAARANADGAFAAYKQTVLTSLEDTENAVVALDSARRREIEFGRAAEAAQASSMLARSQYRAGLTDFTTLNTQEASLLSTRNSLLQARADKAQATIALFVALGGGWDDTTAAPAPSPLSDSAS